MGAYPQGHISWPRMQHFLNGSFALASGVQPSICRITAAAQSSSYAEVGTLGLHYGSRSFEFEDCHLKNLTEMVDDRGQQMALLTIEDRRWRWRGLGRVSGYYNRILRSTNIRPDAKRGLRQLVGLCLSALRETKIDISRVPNDDESAPSIEWDYEDPIIALAQLVEFGRLRVALRPNGSIGVYPKGVGMNVYTNSETILTSRPLESPDRPSDLVVAMGRSLYESSLSLEAVALNRKLKWVPLNKVEYMPPLDAKNPAGPKGWFNTTTDFSNIEDWYDRSLAERSVYRAYRIRVPFGLTPEKREIKDLVEILPVHSEMVTKRDPKADNSVRLPSQVYGSFSGGYENPEPKKKFEEKLDDAKAKGRWRYLRGFTILEEEGIVLCDEPTYQVLDNGKKIENVIKRDGLPDIIETIPRYQTIEAQLFLTTSFNLREKDAGNNLLGWKRYEERFPVKAGSLGGGSRRAYITNDIKRLEVVFESFAAKDSTNEKTLRPFASTLIEGEMERLNFTDGKLIEYAGWYPIYPDGLVAQTTFRLESDGRATMEALVHIEDMTSYEGMREYLAKVKADRNASILRSEEQRIIDARLRAL